MNYLKLSMIILALFTFAAQSCVPEPVATFAPLELATAEPQRAVSVTIRYDPSRCEIWSNLIAETRQKSQIGKVYHCNENWIKADWKAVDNHFDLSVKFEVLQYDEPFLFDAEDCGEVEGKQVLTENGWNIIRFSVDDNFVNCLDGTGDWIVLDLVLLV